MASIATLTDTFGSEDAVLWSGFGSSVAVTGGHLQINCSSSYPGVVTSDPYDLAGSAVTIQVLQVPNTGSATTQLSFRLGQQNNADGDGFSIIWSGGYLLFSEWVSGVNDNTGVAFDPVAHGWWRIRESSGTVFWDTSGDGITWHNQRSKTRTVSSIGQLYLGIRSGFYGTETSPGAALIDNVNAAINPAPPIAAALPWTQPVYFVAGTGTHNVDMSTQFQGIGLSYSVQGTRPSAVAVNSSSGLLSINTAVNLPWTTLTVRATNSSGYAETTVDVWVFTPDKTIASNAPWSSVTPNPGDIVVVRGGTYISPQNVSGWSGTSTSPTRVVAYPGETVLFDCTGLADYAIETNNANHLELRGFDFIDDGECNFALWNNASSHIKVAQCTFDGFKMSAMAIGQGAKNNAGPWTIEYCHIHGCVQQNNPPSGPGGWARGLNIDYSDGSIVRRNHIHNNFGEGIGLLGSSQFTVEDNIVYDNWSVNIYLDNCRNAEIRNNIVWSTDPTMFRGSRAASSILAANEPYGDDHEQPTTGLVVTRNKILAGNPLPHYDGSYGIGGGAGTSVFSPNAPLAAIDSRWL